MADSEVNVKLSVESSAFEAGLESARDGLQDLGAEAKGAGAEAAKAGDGVEDLGDELKVTGDKAGKAGEDVESFGAEAKTTGDKAAKAGDGVEDLGDELKVTGDKAAKAGDGVEDLGGETRELVGKLNQAKSAVSDFAAKLKAAENPEFLDGLADKVEDVAQKLALFAGGLALAGSKATQGFLTAAADMEAYESTLSKVTGSSVEAARLLEQMQVMAAKTPFDVAGIVDAGVKLKSFGQDIDRFLPLAADLAAVFQRDVSDVALGLGKALAGSQDGLTILNDGLGITKRELAAAGAHMTSAGAIALETADDLTALANAIEKVAQQKNFAGAAEDMAEGMKGAFSNVEDAWNQLQASLGGQLKNEAQGIAGMIGGIAEALNALPEPIQKAAAYAVVAGTAASTAVSVGAGMVGVLANVTTALATTGAGTVLLTEAKKKLIGAMLGVQLQGGLTAAAMASISVAALASVAVVAAAGVSLAVYTDILKDNTKAQEELLAIEEKRAQLGRENKDLIGKTAEQVLAMGKTEKDVVHAINLLHEQAQAARAAGNNVLEEQLKRQIADLQRVKVELSERAAVEAQSAGLSAATWEDYSKRVSAGFFETKAAQLQALDAVIAAQKKAGKDTADAELARVALVRQVTEEKLKSAEQEKNAVKKAAEDRLNTELHALKLEEAAGRLTDEQKAARLRGLLESYRETAIGREKLRDLELEASKLEGQAAKKAEEEKRSAAAAALASKLQAIDMERARAASARNLSTQEEIAFQQRVVALHKQGTSERAQAEIALYNLKARLRQEEESALQRLRALEAELVNARIDEIDDQIADLQDKMAAEQEAGRSTAATYQAIVELMREKLAIQLQMIEASTRERMEAEKDPRVKAKLAEVAEKKKADARRDSEREIRRANEAQKRRALDLVKANQDVAGSIRDVGKATQETSRQAQDAYSTMSTVEWTPAPQAADELDRTPPEARQPVLSMMTDEERYETPRQARERRERVAREREEALRSQGEAAEQRTKDRESRVAEDASERKRSWEESWRPPWATLAQAEGQPLNTMTRDQGDQLVALLTQIATNTKTQGGSGGGSLASRLGEASYFSAG